MTGSKLRALLVGVGAAVTLAGCTGYDDGYGYGGMSVGYSDAYYPSSYYGPGYGWYDGFYYPGTGYYVYDRGGRATRWNGTQQRYWQGRRYALRDREDQRDFREFRREGVQDRRNFRTERRDDRAALESGQVTRDQYRADRQADRREFRQDQRGDRREFRRDLRDRPANHNRPRRPR